MFSHSLQLKATKRRVNTERPW